MTEIQTGPEFELAEPRERKLLEITEEYYEELLADRIRLNVLEDVQTVMRTTRWGPNMGKWFIQGTKWFSTTVYGDDIREVIDSWIVMIAKKESES